jgi:RNA polymerase sigma-70 factor (ECF subfamily)
MELEAVGVSSPDALPSAPAEERRLMEQLAQRDPEALARLYDRYSGVVMALGLRILRERTAAEEVVSQSFWQVWEQAERYSAGRGSVGAWVLSIARSRALDLLRAEGRELRRRERLAEDHETLSAATVDPTERLERDQRSLRVREALAALPKEQRECLELAYYGGLSHGEIAAQTGIPLGTVKTRILLAMDKLRSALGAARAGDSP